MYSPEASDLEEPLTWTGAPADPALISNVDAAAAALEGAQPIRVTGARLAVGLALRQAGRYGAAREHLQQAASDPDGEPRARAVAAIEAAGLLGGEMQRPDRALETLREVQPVLSDGPHARAVAAAAEVLERLECGSEPVQDEIVPGWWTEYVAADPTHAGVVALCLAELHDASVELPLARAWLTAAREQSRRSEDAWLSHRATVLMLRITSDLELPGLHLEGLTDLALRGLGVLPVTHPVAVELLAQSARAMRRLGNAACGPVLADAALLASGGIEQTATRARADAQLAWEENGGPHGTHITTAMRAITAGSIGFGLYTAQAAFDGTDLYSAVMRISTARDFLAGLTGDQAEWSTPRVGLSLRKTSNGSAELTFKAVHPASSGHTETLTADEVQRLGAWAIAHGVKPLANVSTGRNEPCPCGSGKKFKRCCGAA